MKNTTIRHKANQNCDYNCYDIKNNDKYQYGCEFEFYINIEKYNFDETIEKILNEIQEFSNVDILVDLASLPSDEDKNNCIQIKPDQSLEDHGIEISIPITSQDGVIYYIQKILPLIEKYGFTNEETGLHFHISTIKKDGVNFNFYAYMLLCHDKKLLSSWKPRTGYSHNVMDILLKNTKSDSRKIKKGTVWNLEKIDPSHIEIKTIGGIDYHKKTDQILSEFNLYAECFYNTHENTDITYSKRLIEEHKKTVKEANKKTQATFIEAVSEAGLIG
jgi:hypothetical protein